MSAKPYEYTGILAKPPSSVEWEYFEREVTEERLGALFLDFGMKPASNPVSLFKLLLKLAERHVPGFSRDEEQQQQKPGRPSGPRFDVDLILAFKRRVDGSGLSDRQAAVYVFRDLKGRDGTPKETAALVARHRRMVKRLLPAEREAIDYMVRRKLPGNIRRKRSSR